MNTKLFVSITALAAASAVNAQTIVDGALPQVTALGGNQFAITQDLTLSGEAILQGTTFVEAGVTLTVAPGTIVRGQPADVTESVPGSLCVSRGGELVAVGSQTNAIIFTTAADTNRERWQPGDAFLDATPATNPLPPFSGADANAGLWGAVTLLGNAPTNRGILDTGIAGEAFIEGFALQNFRTTYGGILPNDCSGDLQFVSIRHSGLTVSEGDEQQGLTLGGVGAGTVLENIDIYCSADDGIEIFGGTAGVKNVIISYVNDDGFDLDQGWTGNAQSVFIIASNIANTPGLVETGSVAEWDGEDGASSGVDTSGEITTTGQPFTAPTMYNFTFYAEGVSSTAVTIDTNFGGNLFNSVFIGLTDNSVAIVDNGTSNPFVEGFGFAGVADRAAQGTFNVASNHFIGLAGTTSVGATTLADDIIGNIIGNSANNVETTGNPFFFGAGAGFGSPFNDQTVANGINPVPLFGANTSLVPVKGCFFDTASYRGAFPQSATALLYTSGWSALNLRGILVDAGNGANIL